MVWELPPRTRRIRDYHGHGLEEPGTTSAHAENTACLSLSRVRCGNYLRARGEYFKVASAAAKAAELPPRTRRIQSLNKKPVAQIGTTSAHAENTAVFVGPEPVNGNYLRARGEYLSLTVEMTVSWELPPRTRRIHYIISAKPAIGGTTSAHAENTLGFDQELCDSRNYLRARGEY